MITYTTRAGAVAPEQIDGFFVGWPHPPSPTTLVDVMDGSFRRVWALERDRVVGYVNAISDGILTAFIPWLEVHPDFQGQGIGRDLISRIVAELDGMYSIDVCCDPELVPYYEKLGFLPLSGAGLRFPRRLE
ncbi:GNAT family N-acetyltransferase [Acidipropionibacterium timonense]|uniref:GNAT family N-acetyltransferase n=1 Tax=Acidipropionibacterium timonense TaxID=2161818 RepID=UPI00102F8209|nr:GNAT family N-acetyltransferase [Acidipropionibacterium timonense]